MSWFTYGAAIPEIFMFGMAMITLLVGAFSEDKNRMRYVLTMTSSTIVAGILLVILNSPSEVFNIRYAFPKLDNNSYLTSFYISDSFSSFVKLLVLSTALIALFLAKDYLKRHKIYKFEYYIVYLLSLIGMMMMASAYDLLSLYLGLEIMSFSLYILAAYNVNDGKSSEAGMKYFVLGSIASGLLLYGISLLYGLTGSTSYISIGQVLSEGTEGNLLLSVSLVMILVGLAFKISAVPFHMWTPDVYQGSPTPVTAFMAIVPKIASVAVLIRFLQQPLVGLSDDWSQMLIVLSILSMGIGSMVAIVQDNIKRMLAYSSIGNIGFILLGVLCGTIQGTQAVLIYLAVYGLTMLGIFAVIISMRMRDVYFEDIQDFAGLGKKYPWLALLMLILMFSLAGVPPFAGFFAKFYVFTAAVQAGYVWLVGLAVLFSVVGAYYCLRLIKVMYFEPINLSFARDIVLPVRGIAFIATFGVIVLGLFPTLISKWAEIAAKSLF